MLEIRKVEKILIAGTRTAVEYYNGWTAAADISKDPIVSEASNVIISGNFQRSSAFPRGTLRHGLALEEAGHAGKRV